MIFDLVQKIITDAKQASRDQGEGGSSFSKLFEKHRIESSINKLLNKLPNEQGLVTEKFIEALVFQNANLSEVPNFFIRAIKNTINSGVLMSKQEQSALEEGKDAPFIVA